MLELQAPVVGIDTARGCQSRRQAATRRSASFRQLKSIMRAASVVLLAYWALIFVGTHLPKGSLPHLHWSDKLYHCGAFAGLGFLLCWAIPSSRFSLPRIVLLAAVLGIGYGILDELTQNFVPGRTCDIWDMAADTIGVLLGSASYLVARGILNRSSLARLIFSKIGQSQIGSA
jgi:VanZ family protein